MVVRLRLDTRQSGPTGLDSNAICELTTGASTRCEPCGDGIPACLAMEYRGVRADKAGTARRDAR